MPDYIEHLLQGVTRSHAVYVMARLIQNRQNIVIRVPRLKTRSSFADAVESPCEIGHAVGLVA
jgi:hypothetical protein